MAFSDLVLSLNVDENSVLPKVSSISEFLGSNESCGLQLLPGGAYPSGTIAESTSPADRWSLNPTIAMRSVGLFKIRDAYYFPEYGVVIDQDGRAMRSSMDEAAYLTPDLLKLPHVARRADEIVFSPPEDVASLSSAAITMPWGGLYNYAHFLIDCLPSIPLFQQIDGLQGVDLVFPTLKQWHHEHLHLLGVAPKELPQKLYRIENAFFTNCMAHFLRSPNLNLQDVPKLQLARAQLPAGGGRRIYLSRRGNLKRRFLSEERLESLLRDKGFEILRPEALPVRDQIAAFASADMVVGCTGAAFANVLYAPPGAIILEIQPRPTEQTWIRNISALMGSRWAPYFCHSLPPEKVVIHGGKSQPFIGISFDFDLDDFVGYLDRLADSQQAQRALLDRP